MVVYFNIHLRRLIRHNDIEKIAASWGAPGSPTQADAHYPTDFSRDIIPIPCHSHNDYWRKVPLYDALAAGCTGVEADVWLKDNDLLVGHSTSSLTSTRSLRSLYIDPLTSILSHQNPPPASQNTTTPTNSTTSGAPVNGIFETNPVASLTLLIDVKSDGATTLPISSSSSNPSDHGAFSHTSMARQSFPGRSRWSVPATTPSTSSPITPPTATSFLTRLLASSGETTITAAATPRFIPQRTRTTRASTLWPLSGNRGMAVWCRRRWI